MNIEIPIVDFPKIHAPFVRVRRGGQYRAVDQTLVLVDDDGNIEADYSWVFDPETCQLAVDKLDGTNVCVHIRGGQVAAVDNRKTRKPFLAVCQTAWEGWMLEGLQYALQRKWLASYVDADVYGELIGPKINGNRHRVDRCMFVPFDFLKRKCAVPEWNGWDPAPRTFHSIRTIMRDYVSPFTSRILKNPQPGEGIVLYHTNGRDMAKIRRDMFDYDL